MKTITLSVDELKEMPVHSVAAAFPPLSEEDLLELAQDIHENGLVHNITVWEGQLLDGRNRLAAIEKTDLVHVDVDVFEGSEYEAVQYIWSVNIKRRHLDTGQRALLTEELRPYEEAEAKRRADENRRANLIQNQGVTPEPLKSVGREIKQGEVNEILAEKSNVSKDTIRKAHSLAMNAPDLADEVKAGEKKLEKAYNELEARRKEDDTKLTFLEIDRHLPYLKKYESRELSLNEAWNEARKADEAANKKRREENPEALVDIEQFSERAVENLREFNLKIGKQMKTTELIDKALDAIATIERELATTKHALVSQYDAISEEE